MLCNGAKQKNRKPGQTWLEHLPAFAITQNSGWSHSFLTILFAPSIDSIIESGIVLLQGVSHSPEPWSSMLQILLAETGRRSVADCSAVE